MTSPFFRSARVVIGEVEIENNKNSDLRITFGVKRSIDRSANTATVQIWNLSERRRAQLEEEQDRLIIEAGYGTPTALFCGNKATVLHTKRGTDWVTIVDATDGLAEMKAQIAVSHAAGVSAKRVVQDAAKKAGLVVQRLRAGQIGAAADAALDALTYSGGKAYVGPVADLLEEVAEDANVAYSVQDCTAVFMSKEDVQTDVLVLSSDSGLVGTPERVRDKKRPNANLILGECLILPSLVPHYRIDIQSTNLSGPYKLNSIDFTGDTHGGAWTARFEAESVAVQSLADVANQEATA